MLPKCSNRKPDPILNTRANLPADAKVRLEQETVVVESLLFFHSAECNVAPALQYLASE